MMGTNISPGQAGSAPSPDFLGVGDISSAVANLDSKLFLQLSAPLLSLGCREQAVHNNVGTGLSQASEHSQAYTLR